MREQQNDDDGVGVGVGVGGAVLAWSPAVFPACGVCHLSCSCFQREVESLAPCQAVLALPAPHSTLAGTS